MPIGRPLVTNATESGSRMSQARWPKLDLRDIELILRHLLVSNFKGTEIPQAHITLSKLKQVHNHLTSEGVDLNAGSSE